ncbi:tetratricopeptide repeat protein [Tenacibaculum ovolyticum]|uniref:tetratricopeptide repeat protein n=1 Tax=Tenacibaculum ovolyticum TaxID=104270 RepID=UPI0007ED66E9|nr:hypothetical protein [Tenacibaculum ovolyticum]
MKHLKTLFFLILLSSCSVKWADSIAEKGFNKEAINDYEKALSIYNKGIRWNKKSAELYWRRGNLHHRNKNYILAIKDLDKSIQIDSLFNTGYAYWDRAISKENLNNYSGALLDYNNAISINPEKSNFYFFRGILKYRLKDSIGAHNDFNSAIELWDNYYLARSWRSILRVELKDFKGAMEDFKYLKFSKKEKLKPKMAWKFRYRGLAKLKTKDTIGACNDWKIATKHNDSISILKMKEYCN